MGIAATSSKRVRTPRSVMRGVHASVAPGCAASLSPTRRLSGGFIASGVGMAIRVRCRRLRAPPHLVTAKAGRCRWWRLAGGSIGLSQRCVGSTRRPRLSSMPGSRTTSHVSSPRHGCAGVTASFGASCSGHRTLGLASSQRFSPHCGAGCCRAAARTDTPLQDSGLRARSITSKQRHRDRGWG
jgi:hypothetical protein